MVEHLDLDLDEAVNVSVWGVVRAVVVSRR